MLNKNSKIYTRYTIFINKTSNQSESHNINSTVHNRKLFQHRTEILFPQLGTTLGADFTDNFPSFFKFPPPKKNPEEIK